MKKLANMKHLSNFTASESRPILTGLHFSGGNIEATDSHILLKLRNVIPDSIEMVLDPNSMKQLEGTYPNTERLFGGSENTVITPSLELIETMFTLAKTEGKKGYFSLVILASDGIVSLKGKSGIEYTVKGLEISGRDQTVILGAANMKAVTDFMKDNFNSDIKFAIDNNVRPLHFYNDLFDVLICPIRDSNYFQG